MDAIFLVSGNAINDLRKRQRDTVTRTSLRLRTSCSDVYIRSKYYRVFLVVILISVIVHDVEEPKLIDALGSRHHSEPVAKLLLLEELLRATSRNVSKNRNRASLQAIQPC